MDLPQMGGFTALTALLFFTCILRLISQKLRCAHYVQCRRLRSPKRLRRAEKTRQTFETRFFGLPLPSSAPSSTFFTLPAGVAPWANWQRCCRRGAAAAEREGGCPSRPRGIGGDRPEQNTQARFSATTSTTRSPSPRGDGTCSAMAAPARPRTHSSHSHARTLCTRCH